MIERYLAQRWRTFGLKKIILVLGLRWKSWLTRHGLSWEKSLRKMWLWSAEKWTWHRPYFWNRAAKLSRCGCLHMAVSETLAEERAGFTMVWRQLTWYTTMVTLQTKPTISSVSDLWKLLNIIADKAKEHKFTHHDGLPHVVCTHFTTFGLKLATWYSEMKTEHRAFRACGRWCGSW